MYQAGFSIDTEPPESGHMIMEADKSKDLQSELDTRRVGVNARNASPKAGRLKTQEESGFPFLSRDRQKPVSQLKAVRQKKMSPYLGVCEPFGSSSRPSTDWRRPTIIG